MSCKYSVGLCLIRHYQQDNIGCAVRLIHIHVDTPASAQMTESPINTNTKSGGMRVEGRVTHPPKSTPTKRRSAAMM